MCKSNRDGARFRIEPVSAVRLPLTRLASIVWREATHFLRDRGEKITEAHAIPRQDYATFEGVSVDGLCRFELLGESLEGRFWWPAGPGSRM